MSHCSCSSCSQISSSLHRNQSYDSYRQWSSSSSITTVSSQNNNNSQQTNNKEEDEWPAPPPPEEEIESNRNTAEIWQFEKSIDLKRQQPSNDSCIFKATMMNGHVVIRDPSARSTIIPGKHFSMKVVFNF